MAKTKTPIQQATTDARKHVTKLMPGAQCFVDTRGDADPITLAPLTRTMVSFPEGHPNAQSLRIALASLPGVRKAELVGGSIIVVRER